MTWSAAQYVKFEDERSRPVADLLAALPTTPVATAVDLGCGPGNSTALLLRRWPGADVVGLDSSPDMIAAARARLPNVRFETADIAAWAPSACFDLILSNAALQWVPDHERLFPALMDKVAPGGSLAVQMPDNLDEPTHRLMRAVAADGPWAARLAGAATTRTARHAADWYYALMRPHATRVDVWRTTYFHPLAGHAAIVEWLRGSGLRPFLDRLDADDRPAFLDHYLAAIIEAYPALPDGTVLLPFPRLFIVAIR